jgi:hypothetical protein
MKTLPYILLNLRVIKRRERSQLERILPTPPLQNPRPVLGERLIIWENLKDIPGTNVFAYRN